MVVRNESDPYDEVGDEVFAPGALSRAHAARLRRRYTAAQAFPHVVIDGLFNVAFLERVLDDFRGGLGDWVHYRAHGHTKRATRPNAPLGPGSRRYFDAIHRGTFTQFLAEITDIDGLLPDPTLFAGGLHEIPPGGRFDAHVDFNKHPVTRLDNRLVFITYLNKDWDARFGGSLKIYGADGECVDEVVPEFGRSILFAHSRHSLHGHPDPVATPDARPRRSLAAYYYTNGTDDLEPEHTTRFFRAPQFGRWGRVIAVANYVSPMLVDCARSVYKHGNKLLRRRSAGQ